MSATLTDKTAQVWNQLYDRRILVGGYGVTFLAPYLAEVETGADVLTVTDFDCSHCGEGCNCAHQAAMYEALDDGLKAPDLDDRREAYYEAGHYPPRPIY